MRCQGKGVEIGGDVEISYWWFSGRLIWCYGCQDKFLLRKLEFCLCRWISVRSVGSQAGYCGLKIRWLPMHIVPFPAVSAAVILVDGLMGSWGVRGVFMCSQGMVNVVNY